MCALICVCECIGLCMHVHVNVCKCTRLCSYICIRSCKWKCVCKIIFVWVCTCVYEGVYKYVYIMCVYLYPNHEKASLARQSQQRTLHRQIFIQKRHAIIKSDFWLPYLFLYLNSLNTVARLKAVLWPIDGSSHTQNR